MTFYEKRPWKRNFLPCCPYRAGDIRFAPIDEPEMGSDENRRLVSGRVCPCFPGHPQAIAKAIWA